MKYKYRVGDKVKWCTSYAPRQIVYFGLVHEANPLRIYWTLNKESFSNTSYGGDHFQTLDDQTLENYEGIYAMGLISSKRKTIVCL